MEDHDQTDDDHQELEQQVGQRQPDQGLGAAPGRDVEHVQGRDVEHDAGGDRGRPERVEVAR